MSGAACVHPWGEYDACPNTASGHECVRSNEHEGRCRCHCGATTIVRDPIFDDPEELELAQDELT